MIYCSIVGLSALSENAKNTGLGNSMFQIAATISLAEENNDIAYFPNFWKFNDYFKIGINIIEPKHVN